MSKAEEIRIVETVLTADCNLRCAYCYQNAKTAQRMPWEILRGAIDLLVRSPQRDLTLSFTGGEPLLEYALIRRAVAYAKRMKRPSATIQYEITTNGTLITSKVARWLATNSFETRLSFDGVRAAQDLRGKGTFGPLDALLARLRKSQPAWFRRHLGVSMTLTTAMLSHLADSIEYMLSTGVRDIGMSPVTTHDPGWKRGCIDDLDREFERVFRVCLRYYRRTGRVPLRLFRRSPAVATRRPRNLAMCGVTRGESITVDVDGKLFGCAALAESYQRIPSGLLGHEISPMRMGLVEDAGFPRRLARFRRATKAARLFNAKQNKYSSYGRCGRCRFLRECSLCPISIAHIPRNTDPDRVPDHLCAFNRVALKFRERFPVERSPRNILLEVARES